MQDHLEKPPSHAAACDSPLGEELLGKMGSLRTVKASIARETFRQGKKSPSFKGERGTRA